jgi:hypothetical protein
MTHGQLVKTIRCRMKQLEMTPYRLHQELGGKVSKQTVYSFLEHGKPASTETLVAIMTVLKLSIAEPEE